MFICITKLFKRQKEINESISTLGYNILLLEKKLFVIFCLVEMEILFIFPLV